MRQYEIAIRIAQVHHLAEERKYKKALTVIQTLDMRQVRNISDLKVFAEVYTRTEQFEAAKATYLRIYKKSRTRRILYRLIYLAIRTNELDDAESYVKTAKCTVRRKRWDGVSINCYSLDGAAYINADTMKIKTAFSEKDFDPTTKAIAEVFKK